MFRNLLNPDNALMITMSQISDCIFLSLFWLLGCFPVITIGAATAALYDASFRAYRKGDKASWVRFFQVFRNNFKASLLPTLVFLAASAGLTALLVGLWHRSVAGSLSWMVFSGAAFLGMVLVGILSIMFPLLSRFENSFAGLLKNTVLLALANVPKTLALGFVNVVSLMLCARFVFPLFFLPSLAALIGSLFIEPMFRPFMPVEEDAA